MQGAGKFLDGFSLNPGTNIGGWSIKDVNAGETTVKRNHDYQYPITIIICPISNGNMSDPVSTLNQYTSGERTIKSDYGNPYSCSIKGWSITNNTKDGCVTLQAMGESHRIYNKW